MCISDSVTPAQVEEKPSDPPIVRKYYMHGCSHFLGLDVHDVGETNPVVPMMQSGSTSAFLMAKDCFCIFIMIPSTTIASA